MKDFVAVSSVAPAYGAVKFLCWMLLVVFIALWRAKKEDEK